jgi:hypothetical protein
MEASSTSRTIPGAKPRDDERNPKRCRLCADVRGCQCLRRGGDGRRASRRGSILYQEQASELDPKRCAAILHKIQQLMHERVVFAPLLEPALLNGYGPRVADSGLGLIVGHLYSAPYEDLTLKGK